ncbi:MAG: IclR family transcriptional regulator domain-containing protein [Halanaerobiales bacterium]
MSRIREQGYAVDDEEHKRDIRCIGGPVWIFRVKLLLFLLLPVPK